MYARILVPLDGSPAAERVLPHAEALAERFGAALTLLHATTAPATVAAAEAAAGVIPVAPIALDPIEIVTEEQREAAAYLSGLAGRLRARGLSVDVVEPEGDSADAILTAARDLGVDLITMTTHGHGGLGRLVLGSVTDEVVRHAPCPVLVVRVHDR
jgi:nucleotide-binding universal stress UspA family protein